MSTVKTSIFIPTKGMPRVITDPINVFPQLIGCSTLMDRSIIYLELFGYRIELLMDDCFALKDLPPNRIATLIFKESVTIRGNCIMMDYDKSLSIEDLSKIVKIAQIIPTTDWIPEPSINRFRKRRPKGNDEYTRMINRTYDNYIRSNPRYKRVEIWNQVKELYNPI